MEDITVNVRHVGSDNESIEDANLRFVEFQRYLELKRNTKFLRYKIHRDFTVCCFNTIKAISDKIDTLMTAEEKLIQYLVDKKIYFSVQGEFKTIDEVFTSNFKCVETTLDNYLDNNIGSLTYDQILHLSHEHDLINRYHNELYALIEFVKVTRG